MAKKILSKVRIYGSIDDAIGALRNGSLYLYTKLGLSSTTNLAKIYLFEKMTGIFVRALRENWRN